MQGCLLAEAVKHKLINDRVDNSVLMQVAKCVYLASLDSTNESTPTQPHDKLPLFHDPLISHKRQR